LNCPVIETEEMECTEEGKDLSTGPGKSGSGGGREEAFNLGGCYRRKTFR
jgi:hypothetical protein